LVGDLESMRVPLSNQMDEDTFGTHLFKKIPTKGPVFDDEEEEEKGAETGRGFLEPEDDIY